MGILLIDGKTLFPRKSGKADAPNQRLMMDRILSLSAESGVTTSLAILQIGDSRRSCYLSSECLPALKILARLLREETPKDLLYDRYGDTGMICLCPGCILTEVGKVVKAIWHKFHEEVRERGRWDTVILTGGLAEFPQHGVTRAEILRRAEEALYIALYSGGDSIQVPPKELQSRLSIELSRVQIERLKQRAEQEGVETDDLIREAIDDLLRGNLGSAQ
ncbi:MAG TPA: hypothetical protein PLZ55_00425 [bacterium]|nr:hypothetical protein [bacterium]HPO07102.1 hypothetical protein [bacterium]HQO36965.1 hypothetical protein [bacterium]HQP98791.1 hypothetical protein [bacterium]